MVLIPFSNKKKNNGYQLSCITIRAHGRKILIIYLPPFIQSLWKSKKIVIFPTRPASHPGFWQKIVIVPSRPALRPGFWRTVLSLFHCPFTWGNEETSIPLSWKIALSRSVGNASSVHCYAMGQLCNAGCWQLGLHINKQTNKCVYKIKVL